MLAKPGLKPAERAAGANAHHDSVNAPFRLRKKLRRGGGLMRQRVGRVIKLINVKRAGRFIGEALRVILVIGRVAFVNVRAGKPHIHAQRAQVINFLAAHFVRHHQDQLVALLGGDKRKAEAGVARRGFNNGAAGRKPPQAFGLVNHRERHAVFNRTAGVLVFQFQQQFARAGIELCEAQQRRLPDKRGYRIDYRHGRFIRSSENGQMIGLRFFAVKE
ncbi:hypothetical protein BN136_3625 [Cronobacter universalis NCTC 9529]|nr:hypothetical protein BN136_3625 [Cronobacter universalis NCTC 9529]